MGGGTCKTITKKKILQAPACNQDESTSEEFNSCYSGQGPELRWKGRHMPNNSALE